MPKIMLEKEHYARLILAVFHALFHPRRHEHNISLYQLQISNWQPWWIDKWPVLTAWQNDATVQQADIESSNQAFEYVNPH